MTPDNEKTRSDDETAGDVKPAEEADAPARLTDADPSPAAEAAAEPAPEPTPEPAHRPKGGRHHEREQAAERALAEARREAAEFKDRYLRSAAEMENLRKRLEREKSEFLQFAQADLFKEILAVLDNFERALRAAPDADPAGFQEGIGLIHKQMTALLAKRGVTPIEPSGGAFDPEVQQAIATEASDEVEEPVVAEELQRGYRLHDRLLRPALVRVLVPRKD